MYDQILIPTDGSPGTERAVEHGFDIAKQYGAALHVLYVIDTNALPLDAHSQAIVESRNEMGQESVTTIVERAEELGIEPVVSAVLEGLPYEVILEYVDDHAINLIIMGTHGRRGLDRFLLGSTTERIVRFADVPVLTVRMDEMEAE